MQYGNFHFVLSDGISDAISGMDFLPELNHLKSEVHPNDIYKFSSYIIENVSP